MCEIDIRPVIDPAILLLDEPFSNLDAKLRDSTGQELRRIQRSLGLTSIFVTPTSSKLWGSQTVSP